MALNANFISWTCSVLTILFLSSLAKESTGAAINCDGIARVRVRVWSYSDCGKTFTLEFENTQMYPPYQNRIAKITMGAGTAGLGPVNTNCKRDGQWSGAISYGYGHSRDSAFNTGGNGGFKNTMIDSRWRLTRMSRDGGPVLVNGKAARFRQDKDLFITLQPGSKAGGTCIDGDSHVACFYIEVGNSTEPDGLCSLPNGNMCIPRPPATCELCGSRTCPA